MQTKHGNEEQYDELVTHFMINDNLRILIKPEKSGIEARPPNTVSTLYRKRARDGDMHGTPLVVRRAGRPLTAH